MNGMLVRCFCSPQRTDSALYPTIGQLERAAGFKQDDTAGAKLDKLDELLARSATSRHDSALLAELLSLPNDGRYPTSTLDVEKRRRAAIVERVGLHSTQNRVIFAAGGFGYFATLALYSPTAFSNGPATHSYISPMLCSSRGSDSMLKTLG